MDCIVLPVNSGEMLPSQSKWKKPSAAINNSSPGLQSSSWKVPLRDHRTTLTCCSLTLTNYNLNIQHSPLFPLKYF